MGTVGPRLVSWYLWTVARLQWTRFVHASRIRAATWREERKKLHNSNATAGRTKKASVFVFSTTTDFDKLRSAGAANSRTTGETHWTGTHRRFAGWTRVIRFTIGRSIPSDSFDGSCTVGKQRKKKLETASLGNTTRTYRTYNRHFHWTLGRCIGARSTNAVLFRTPGTTFFIRALRLNSEQFQRHTGH